MRPKLKYLLSLTTALAAGYAAWQAVTIAGFGVANRIVQLEGDGGGGLVAALFWLLAAALCLVRLSVALFIYLVTSVAFIMTAWLYSDSFMWVWAFASALSALLAYGLRRRSVARMD